MSVKTKTIIFQNTEAKQAGNGLTELRNRNKLSREEFASKANISVEYLSDLEEGRYDKVSPEIIEQILESNGIDARGKGRQKSNEELKAILLTIRGPIP